MTHSQQSIQSICLAYTQAMFAAQQLESDIVFILTFHHESCPNSPEETLSLIKTAKEKSERLPLGRLIEPLKERIPITPKQEAILTDALNLRNDLAHNFLRRNYQSIIDPDVHEDLHSDIQATTATLKSAANELKPYRTAVLTAFSSALAETPQTAETIMLQSLLERLLDPAESFPAIAH